MSFEKPITIKDAVEKISSSEYFMPAIQREFVWKTTQIEKLFDSIIRDYPINSFLFWEVKQENLNKYQFYKFIDKYHEIDARHNERANLSGRTSGITAILDGQQRLTSLYIGLKGSYSYKLPHYKQNNPLAFPKRTLCLNLLSPSAENNLKYDFKFLTNEERKKAEDNHFWFVVGDILDITDLRGISNYLSQNGLEKSAFASDTMCQLLEVIHKNQSINFFLEKDDDLDKVLDIFIRVNSGGTPLNYSDLLLSTATSYWKKIDAKEVILEFVDTVNKIGGGFNINKDFVLKSCLVLGGFKEIAFKVDNFTKNNMLQIEADWINISKAIQAAVILVYGFGYTGETLTSNAALIPIALYLLKIGIPNHSVKTPKELNKFVTEQNRKKIARLLVIVLLKRTFGAHPDKALRDMREVINSNTSDDFPYDAIFEKLKGTEKSIAFSDDEIENLFKSPYGYRVFPVLVFIYPTLKFFEHKFDQDHIFPKSKFTERKLAASGIPQEKIKFYMDNYNCLANLEFLTPEENNEKRGKEFNVWLEKYPKNSSDRKDFMEKHYIPMDIDLSIENFEEFINKRKELIRDAFKKLLI